MSRLNLMQLTGWITAAAVQRPLDLSAYVAERTSRAALRCARFWSS